MKNIYKQALTAATFAMLTALPLSAAQAADLHIGATASKGSAYSITTEALGAPKNSDGEIITQNKKPLAFDTQDTTAVSCWVCTAVGCFAFC